MYSVSILATNDRSDEEIEKEIHVYALKSEKAGYFLPEYYEQIQCNSNGVFAWRRWKALPSSSATMEFFFLLIIVRGNLVVDVLRFT